MIASIPFGSTPKRRIEIIAEAPQSIRKLASPRLTKKQVFKRPPEPNASPQPRNFTSRAFFRQQDQSQPWKGTVAWAGVPESDASATSIPAAIAPGPNNSLYRVIVALDEPSNASNCPAGKFGRVIFETTRAIATCPLPVLNRF